jgi:hypothetical protein
MSTGLRNNNVSFNPIANSEAVYKTKSLELAHNQDFDQNQSKEGNFFNLSQSGNKRTLTYNNYFYFVFNA